MSDQKKIVKMFSTEIKSVNIDAMTVDAVVSTKKVDRDGDIILPEAFTKRLKLYKDHPVLLSSHFYHDLKSQIGEAKSVKITDAGLEVQFKYYAGEGNDQADWAFILAQKGIAAFSIGFMGMEYEWIKEKRDGGVEVVTGRKYLDVELLEISQVLVPSNRGALQSGRSMLAAESEIFELAAKGFESGALQEFAPKAAPDYCKREGNDCRGSVSTRSADEKSFFCGFCKKQIDPEIVKQENGAQVELCGCELLNVKFHADKKDHCGVCEKQIADDKLEAIQKFSIALSGCHYSESLLPTGAKGSLPSAKEATEAVQQAFKNL